ncbi:unnamed protein product [Strongylus vulgaris]|uniref:Methyltransferase type 11 domain-containing protein n=1 Tax=Strongylus vulgaris TaxID=40348 RepID=A0A3P7ITE1_STRVU|nr:unnamed protein product [Strongylus vulgaris]
MLKIFALYVQKFTCNVWNVELNENFYRTSLTKANNQKDQRVRFGWNESLTSSLDYWSQREASFDCFIGTELLSTNDNESIKMIASIMEREAKFVLLEPVDGVDEETIKEVSIKLCSHTEILVRKIEEYL